MSPRGWGSCRLLALVPALAFAQDRAEDSGRQDAATHTLAPVVVTGTRVSGRSATDTAAPVDVLVVGTLQRGGSSELNQALSVALPSFNFPRSAITDGSDTVRPASLRGLSPDQTLVLVNSKRRHSAALVNLSNNAIGTGASAVDLNTLPMAAIRSIEVLRDGASAQYGSDAIAGVINVLLREQDSGGSASLSYGWRESNYRFPVDAAPVGATWPAPAELERQVSDGEVWTASAWTGLRLGREGFLTISAEHKHQQRSERDGYDARQQYPRIGNAFDPREQTIDRFNGWSGDPELRQSTVFANAGLPLDHGLRLYGWASQQNREARSAGFFRRALEPRNVIEIYPDGFLPIIAPRVQDTSAALGLEWQWRHWDLDSSLVFGQNRMHYRVENSVNASIGPASPTEFDAGGMRYRQWLFNLSGVRSVEIAGWASSLNMAAGLEARQENYRIVAGEPDSYRFGGRLLANGSPAAPGAQVFPGFQPSNEVDDGRTATSLYLDLEATPREALLLSLAARAEHYSDFGHHLSGKLALRYDLSPRLAVRGSLQTGFRAPSPQQQLFTTTSTNSVLSGGVVSLVEISTFPATHPVALALGSQPLDAEESVNGSLGLILSGERWSFTLDAYRIDIDNRIVLSENLIQPNVGAYLNSLGFIGISGGRFFINGVDSETRGVDAVLNWQRDTRLGRFELVLAGNHNRTRITRVPETAPLAALDPAPELFSRINIAKFEHGAPAHKFTALLSWQRQALAASLRLSHYGKVLEPFANPADDVWLGAETVLDAEARYQFDSRWQLAVGADNLLDQYPDAMPAALNNTGNLPFLRRSPFGFMGRFVYARVTLDF